MSTLCENYEYELPINYNNNSNLIDISNFNLNNVSIQLDENLEYLKMDKNELSKLMTQLKEWNLSFLYQTCVGRY